MEPFEKIELIVRGTLARKKKDHANGKGKASNIYLLGLEHEISALESVLADINCIKRNTPNMADDVLLKMYGLPSDNCRM